MMFYKLLIALAAALAAAQGQGPKGAGWQAGKGEVLCVRTVRPDGSAECRCRRR